MSFFSKLFKNHRREAFEKLAFRLEMDFSKKDNFGFIKLLKQFNLFRRGHSGKVTNLLRRKDEWLNFEVAIFDYRYVVGGGNSTRIFNQTVFFIQSKSLSLPQFLLKPEHFFHRVGKFLGMTQDIEYESHSDFSDKYIIQGEEASLIQQSLPEDLAHFFSIEKKWSLEGMNYFLIFYQNDKKLPPETIEDFYKKGLQIFDWLKEEGEKRDG